MHRLVLGATILLALAAGATVYGGVVKLKNGDEITGKVIERTDSHIKLKTEYGELEIPLEKVDSVLEQVRLHLKNGTAITGEIISRTDKEIKLQTPLAQEPMTIPAGDVEKIEPLDGKEAAKKEEPQKPAPAADADALQSKAMEHLRKKEYEKSIEAYRKYLELEPDDEIALYNLACAYSLAGRKAEAVECLRKAVEAGYADFDHIQSDTDLDGIRGEEGYKKLFEEKEKYLGAAADGIIERYKKKLGDEYQYIKDEKYKLVVVSNVDKKTLDGLHGALQAYADCHWKDFFKNKPKYYITVLIPSSSVEYRR
jgi:tetratricopeptide (TPR) repeat protein